MRRVLSFVLGVVVMCGAALAQVPVKPVDGTGAELSGQVRTYVATIAASGTVSTVVALNGCTMIRVLMPTTASGWSTANITFSYSDDNSTWLDLADEDGGAVTLVAAANKAIQISNPGGFVGIKYIKLVSTATQIAERELKVVCKPM